MSVMLGLIHLDLANLCVNQKKKKIWYDQTFSKQALTGRCTEGLAQSCTTSKFKRKLLFFTQWKLVWGKVVPQKCSWILFYMTWKSTQLSQSLKLHIKVKQEQQKEKAAAGPEASKHSCDQLKLRPWSSFCSLHKFKGRARDLPATVCTQTFKER